MCPFLKSNTNSQIVSFLLHLLHSSVHACARNCYSFSRTLWLVFPYPPRGGTFGGVGISRTNADAQWNPVYNAFHRSFGWLQTKRFVSSFVNVILTWQTCGQSLGLQKANAELGNYFSERNCYMFLISKCRGDWDLGLYTTSLLAFGEPMCSGDFPTKKSVSTQEKSDFATALRFKKGKWRSCAQT